MDKPVLYGIPNCDTVRKARAWLSNNNIDYTFHDYKKKGIDKKTLNRWCKEWGWEALVNRRGTTWRKLPEEEKQSLDQRKAVSLLEANTSLIKRPIMEHEGGGILGFDENQFKQMA